ncbi:MAG TPA: DUF1643 domain-containing protein [Candidatus Limnocylindria bacterium]|nr:DUF1643 domain-containing protein [Candidatus Limnocylindria bacterium]
MKDDPEIRLSIPNRCEFSADRVYRYSLLHRMRTGGRRIAWIGLNPSTADESQLDPTLRRIRGFSEREGFDEFMMLNVFGLRSTDPTKLLDHPNPIGPDNFAVISKAVRECSIVMAAWGGGKYSHHCDAAVEVGKILRKGKAQVLCLGMTGQGFPKHPLYVHGSTVFQELPLP